jgi:hypothetical protein
MPRLARHAGGVRPAAEEEVPLLQRPVFAGVLAAFVGSLAMTVLIALAGASDLMPRSGTIRLLSSAVGAGTVPAAGWFVFFSVFTLLWGSLYGLFVARLPGRSGTTRGLLFGSAAWLVMMLVLVPLAGFDWIAGEASVGFIYWSLFIHLVYGAVLGVVFAGLTRRRAARADAWPGSKAF